MGYETSFSLSIEPGSHSEKEIFWELRKNDNACYALNISEADSEYECRAPAKWYSHEKDMLALSKKFPEATFLLEGEGEEQGDLWKHHYRNGRVQRRNAIISFTEYDPTWDNALDH